LQAWKDDVAYSLLCEKFVDIFVDEGQPIAS
jgi:hypothetical protein